MILCRLFQSFVCYLCGPLQPDDHRFWQRLQATFTFAFGQCLQRCRPRAEVPTLDQRDQGSDFLRHQLPDAPPRPTPLVIQPRPLRSTAAATPPLQQARIEQLAVQPDAAQGAASTRPQLVEIEQALPPLDEQFDLPTTTIQGQDRLGAQDLWRQTGQDQDELGEPERRGFRGIAAFLPFAPTAPPCRFGLSALQAVSLNPDLISLALRRDELRLQRPSLARRAVSEHLRDLQRRSTTREHREGVRVVAPDHFSTALQHVR